MKVLRRKMGGQTGKFPLSVNMSIKLVKMDKDSLHVQHFAQSWQNFAPSHDGESKDSFT